MDHLSRPITLQWHGPYTFRQLLTSEQHKRHFSVPGVYIWIDHSVVPEQICYVGRATGAPDLWIRQWSHYTSLIAGHYQIPEWSRPGRGHWEMDPSDLIVVDTIFDEDKYVQLVHDGFEYAKQLRLFLCPLDSPLVRGVERQLLYDLQPVGTTWGTKTPPTERLPLLHENPGWLTPSTQKQVHANVKVA